MDVKLNFVSTVVIGRFNPGILTMEFLKKECGIDLGEGSIIGPGDLPVHKEIIFKEKNIHFRVDLERLVIKEDKITKLVKVFGPQFLRIYLDRLHYTPVFACGMNFNLTVELQEQEKKAFGEFLNDDRRLFNLFKIDDFRLETDRKYNKSGSVLNSLWNITFAIREELNHTIRIRLAKSDNIYELNHNIEAPNLKENIENIKFITEGLDQNIKYHNDIMDKLFKGVKNE
jgi:hypothetical protein